MTSHKQSDKEARLTRALFVTLGDPRNTAVSDIVVRLREAGFDCDQLVLRYDKRWKRLIKAFWSARSVADYDVVITNEYNNAFAFSVVGRILRNNAKNIIIGMNLSGRALKFGLSVVDNMISNVFRNLTRIVVHSREEIDLFIRLHDIPRDKFTFSSWGFDAPKIAGATKQFNSETPPYFCMIGRNNRDFATFSAALANCDVDGVIVCPREDIILA